jgi:hypothetical protein
MERDKRLDDILGLSPERFEKAREEAENLIRKSTPQPDQAAYRARDFAKHPPAVTAGALVALAFVAVAMFWISAGKALVAGDMVLRGMVEDYGRLTPVWLDMALGAFLASGEVGSMIFLAGPVLLGAKGTAKRIFTVTAIACACGALISNVSVTALHPEDIAAVPVFGWFMAVMPPLVVLSVGLFLEYMLIVALEGRAKAREAYNEAVERWEQAQRDVTQHPDYDARLAAAILEQVARISPANKRRLAEAVEADPGVRQSIVDREFLKHMWAWSIALPSVQSGVQRPVEHVEQKALPAPIQPIEHVEQSPPEPPRPEPLTPALSKAIAWLEADPARLSMSIREQASGAGVSIGTMATARARATRPAPPGVA